MRMYYCSYSKEVCQIARGDEILSDRSAQVSRSSRCTANPIPRFCHTLANVIGEYEVRSARFFPFRADSLQIRRFIPNDDFSILVQDHQTSRHKAAALGAVPSHFYIRLWLTA